MSAAVLLTAVAPSAPVKGAKVDARASSDAEVFGAALEEASPADFAPQSAQNAKAEAAPQPSAEPASAPEAAPPTNDTAMSTVVLAAVVPPPPTVPVASSAGDGAALEATAAAVAPVPSPTLDAEAAPVDGVSPAPSPSGETETGDPTLTQPTLTQSTLAQPTRQSRPVETAQREKPVETPPADAQTTLAEDRPRKSDPAPAEPAKLVTPVASDRAREVANVRSAVITPLRPARPAEPATPAPATESPSAAEGETTGATEDAPAVAPPATPPAETIRVRDVIDRALARPSAQGTGSAEGQGTRADVKTSADASPVALTTPGGSEPSIARSPIEIPAAVLPPASVDDALAAPLSAAPTAPEARATETASAPLLSTLSRAAVETTAQIAAQIVRKLEGRSTRFEMALTPDDLGRVDVSLDIDADGALHATLAFDNPVAATELRGRADELRRQLVEAGFSVADDALSFAERDPSAGQGGAFDREADPRNARAFGAASRLTAEADLSLQTPAWISLSLTPTGVDMKV